MNIREKILDFWNKLPRFVRSFYFIMSVVFILWMAFFDVNDFYTQYKLKRRINALEAEKSYYKQEIKEVKEEQEELFSDPKLLEKFAREKYFMKKETEDIYVLVEKDK